jgi:YVTN family beta-propeller protein
VTDRRRPSINDRGPGVDLFDDPPWRMYGYDERPPMARLRHLGFVLVLVVLGLLGGGLLLVGIAFVSFFHGFSLDLGSLNFNNWTPPPSAYGIDIALSSDGTRAYVTEPSVDRLVVLDTRTGAVLATVAVGDTPTGLALSPNGTQVWVVDTDLSSTPGTPSTSGSPSTTGPELNSDGTAVTVVSTATDSVVGTITLTDLGPIDVAFSPDGQRAFVTDNGTFLDGSVNVIDTSTLAVVGTIAPKDLTDLQGWNPTTVAVSSDGGQLWVSAVNDMGDSPGTRDDVDVFAPATGAQLAQIPVGTGPFFMVLSADGRDAYVADKLSCDIRQIDTATLQVVATVSWPPDQGCPFGLAAGPDGAVYTVTGDDHTFDEGNAGDAFGSVHFTPSPGLWQTTVPPPTTVPPQATVLGSVGTDPVTVALSPDGSEAYVVDADQPDVEVVDTATGAVTATFTLPN